MSTGWNELAKDYKGTLTLEELEEHLLDIFKIREEAPRPPNKLPLGLLSYQEVRAITDISEEEYENSSGLYRIADNCFTGYKGWVNFNRLIYDERKTRIFTST